MTLRSAPEQRQFIDVDGRTYRMAVPEFTLNDRLARARTYAGYSQEHMAMLLGVSRRTIVRYESEGAKVPRAVLLGYHVACMVDLPWLETGVASTPEPNDPQAAHDTFN